MTNRWVENSKTFQFPGKLWSIILDSTSARIVEKVMSLWDKIVSGSVAIAWITGHELGWKPISKKSGIFGGFFFSIWKKFLGFLGILFGKDSVFQKSFFVRLSKAISSFSIELPFVAVGIFCAGFFGTIGILKLTILGVSLREITVIFACFVVSVLIMFIRVPIKHLFEGSWFLTKLQEIDD
jgi:hypothetical protein